MIPFKCYDIVKQPIISIMPLKRYNHFYNSMFKVLSYCCLENFVLKLFKQVYLIFSFLIGGDGTVLEGRGWLFVPGLPQKYKDYKDKSIFIGLMGEFRGIVAILKAFFIMRICSIYRGITVIYLNIFNVFFFYLTSFSCNSALNEIKIWL